MLGAWLRVGLAGAARAGDRRAEGGGAGTSGRPGCGCGSGRTEAGVGRTVRDGASGLGRESWTRPMPERPGLARTGNGQATSRLADAGTLGRPLPGECPVSSPALEAAGESPGPRSWGTLFSELPTLRDQTWWGSGEVSPAVIRPPREDGQPASPFSSSVPGLSSPLCPQEGPPSVCTLDYGPDEGSGPGRAGGACV